jgi:hypothetical protein
MRRDWTQHDITAAAKKAYGAGGMWDTGGLARKFLYGCTDLAFGGELENDYGEIALAEMGNLTVGQIVDFYKAFAGELDLRKPSIVWDSSSSPTARLKFYDGTLARRFCQQFGRELQLV